MEELKFSTNWNEKLFARHFTTLRLHNPQKYFKGQKFDIKLKCKNEYKHWSFGEVMQVITTKLENLNDYICYLDTGYNKAETLKIIHNMYLKSGINLDEADFDIILVKRYHDAE